jgi:hypothetical protein
MPRQSIGEIKERAERIRHANAVRRMADKPSPLFIPAHLAQKKADEAAGKTPSNEIDIDKLASEAQDKAREEQEQLNAEKPKAADDKKKVMDYTRGKVSELKKDALVKIVVAGEIKVDKQKPKAILIDAIMEACESKGTEWVLKMI